MLKGILVMSCIRPCVHCSWAWLCALRTNRLEEMANKLACSCIQMTYAQLSLTIMGIIAYVSVWLSVGVFICWVWFGEGKGDILMLMCYILHTQVCWIISIFETAPSLCQAYLTHITVTTMQYLQILHCMAINNEFLNSQGQASKVTFM